MNEATFYHIFQTCLCYSLFCLPWLPFRHVCIGCKLILQFNCGVVNLWYHPLLFCLIRMFYVACIMGSISHLGHQVQFFYS